MARGLRLTIAVTTNLKLFLSMSALLLAAACGGNDGVARADQQNYEIVQEGSANGVTSTIQGPGETLPPLTGTNADVPDSEVDHLTGASGADWFIVTPTDKYQDAKPEKKGDAVSVLT